LLDVISSLTAEQQSKSKVWKHLEGLARVHKVLEMSGRLLEGADRVRKGLEDKARGKAQGNQEKISEDPEGSINVCKGAEGIRRVLSTQCSEKGRVKEG
jgi:hypothetical protein